MRARVAIVIVGGNGKDIIIAATINRCHWHRWLNPTAAAFEDNHYCHRQQPPSTKMSPEDSRCCLSLTTAMAVIVDQAVHGSRGNGGLC